MKKIFFILALIALISVGCSYNSSVTLKDSECYIKIVGQTEGMTMILDDKVSVDISNPDKKEMQYKYNEGNHKITIKKNNNIILEKYIILEKGKITEVHIP